MQSVFFRNGTERQTHLYLVALNWIVARMVPQPIKADQVKLEAGTTRKSYISVVWSQKCFNIEWTWDNGILRYLEGLPNANAKSDDDFFYNGNFVCLELVSALHMLK